MEEKYDEEATMVLQSRRGAPPATRKTLEHHCGDEEDFFFHREADEEAFFDEELSASLLNCHSCTWVRVPFFIYYNSHFFTRLHRCYT